MKNVVGKYIRVLDNSKYRYILTYKEDYFAVCKDASY